MTTARIRFKHDTLEIFGDHSLAGMIVENVGQANFGKVTEVILEFEQTSLGYRQKNNGPKTVMMPEYTPLTLVKQILSLMARGITVKTEEIIV